MSKITISVSDLKTALPGFSRVISKRTTLPVLGCILFESKKGLLHLTGTNLDDYVTKTVGGISGELQAAIPFESLNKIVKGCVSESILTIEAFKEEVRVSYPLAGTLLTERINCPPAPDFPAIPSPQWQEEVTVGDDFKQAVREALDSASLDGSRFVLNSAFVDVSDPQAHYIVGTNGKELYTANSFQLGFKESVIVPNRKFLVWKTFMEDGDWSISLSVPVPPNHKGPILNCIKVQSEGWTLITKQIDGTYPHWRGPIPDPNSAGTIVSFTPEASEFVINAAPRLPGANTACEPVKIQTNGPSVFLAAKDGTNDVLLPVVGAKAEGENTIVGLNRQLLIKALKLGLQTAELHGSADPMPMAVFRRDGKRLVIAGLRPDAAAPTVTSQSQPQPATQSSPSDAVQDEKEEKQDMKTANRIEHVPTETTNSSQPPASAFDQVRIQLENVRDKLKAVVSDLNDSLKLLTQAHKERRATEKEIEEVRETLQSLQKIRI